MKLAALLVKLAIVRSIRLLGFAVIVAVVLIVAVVFEAIPALAHGPSYGKWTYAGSGKSWHGTFSSGVPIVAVDIQTTAGARNPVVSFVLDGKRGHVDHSWKHGDVVVYVFTSKGRPVTLKNVTWKLRVKKPLASSKLINPCTTASAGLNYYYCRFKFR